MGKYFTSFDAIFFHRVGFNKNHGWSNIDVVKF